MRSRRRLLGIVVSVGTIVVLASTMTATWAQAPTPGPAPTPAPVDGAGDRAVAQGPVLVPAPEPPDDNRQSRMAGRFEAQQASERLAAERRAIGQLPLEEQLTAGVTSGTLPALSLDQAWAVVTFDVPMPIDVYRQVLLTDTFAALSSEARATVYLEMADGYPWTVSGPTDADLLGNLGAYMDNAIVRLRSEPGTEQHLATPGAAANFADAVEATLPNLEASAVVLGLTIPAEEYRKVSAALETAGIAAVEAAADFGAAPFKNPSGRLDLAEARQHYADHALLTEGR